MPRPGRNADERERRTLALIARVRRYLASHPEAQDDLSGVRELWLDGELFEPDAAMVEAVLGRMVKARQLVAITIDGKVLYRSADAAV